MSHSFPKVMVFALLIAGTTAFAQAQDREPVSKGRPLSSWIDSIRDGDEDMDMAFQAIQSMGPGASAAVPEMMDILDQPFVGIRIGVDDDDEIAQKLSDIQLRSDAVDSLAAMGSAAAPATVSLIKWALTKRVIPENLETERDYKSFVDLVSMDVLERVRVVNVISGFPREAAPAILRLINSSNKDEQKLAVAILQEHTLPIAAALLKSAKCDDRKLGVAILMDLWSVVPADHLLDLRLSAECSTSPGGPEN
jgi:hypothetical protein